tara:strand:- start:1175 stop:1861 length:687 start_codon:yes stop_codon:yes gene_type:complete
MNVCLIPARSGSKRIKNKNILKINNKPIINWTIQTARNSNIFDRICVSTDSLKISNIVKKVGVKVPFLRPKKYATDKSTDEDVINHFLKYAKKEKIQLHSICYFYPTSILITEKILIKSFKKFKKSKANYLLSICSYSAPLDIALKLKGESLVEFLNSKDSKKRTQDMKKYYHDAGQFYWFKVKDYKIIKDKQFNYFYLDKKMSVDVDSKEDLEMLKILYKNKKSRNS